MNYQDIINENKLPIDLNNRISLIKVKGLAPQIKLDMTVDEFIVWANNHNVNDFFGNIILYEYDEVAITSKVSDIIKELIVYMILDKDNIEYDYLLLNKFNDILNNKNEAVQKEIYTKVNRELLEKETYNCNIEDYIDLSLFDSIDDDDDEDYDDDEDEIDINDIELNYTANNIINDIIQNNKNIPDDIFNIPKHLVLGCIVDNIIYLVDIENDLDFKPILFESLMSILQKYQSNMIDGISIKNNQLELQKQKESEEQAKIIQDHNDFLKFMLTNVNYTKLTVPQKLIYIENMWMNKYGKEQQQLIRLAYPDFNDNILKNQIDKIKNEIQMFKGD